MKKIYLFTVLCVLWLPVFSESLTGFDVMKKVDERPKPVTSTAKVEMALVNAKGSTRVRSMAMYKKQYTDETKQVLVFLKPADVKGVAYLSVSYDGKKDDDRWLYMPALKKTRRISGSGTGDSFVGSDFSYDDMGGYKLADYDYQLETEEVIDGRNCWKVTCTPHKKKQYTRFVTWIDKETLLQVRAEFYDKQNALLKILVLSNIEQESGFWVAKKMSMENVQTKHRTLISVLQTEYNKDIQDSLFRVSSLETGIIR